MTLALTRSRCARDLNRMYANTTVSAVRPSLLLLADPYLAKAENLFSSHEIRFTSLLPATQ